MSTALAIFVKTPGRSPVKTRLATTLGRPAAEQFHLLAARAVGEMAAAVGRDVVAYWAVAEAEALNDPAWQGLPCVAQGAGGLGARQARVYDTLLAHHACVLFTGADLPHLDAALLHDLCENFAAAPEPFLLGPAEDGGYWLFGGKQPLPAATWTSVTYSCPTTAGELRSALSRFGAVATAPRQFDVDKAQDLSQLAAALAAAPTLLPAQRALLAWLRESLPVGLAR